MTAIHLAAKHGHINILDVLKGYISWKSSSQKVVNIGVQRKIFFSVPICLSCFFSVCPVSLSLSVCLFPCFCLCVCFCLFVCVCVCLFVSVCLKRILYQAVTVRLILSILWFVHRIIIALYTLLTCYFLL